MLAALVAAACAAPPPDLDVPVPAPVPLPVPDLSSSPALAPAPAPAPAPAHVRIDGQSFPDHVLSLTWDDGPDASTLALASYLKRRHVSATFFVVASWIQGLSDEPGRGKGVFETGYEHLPILADLVGLGHRLGNHTLHHVVLREAAGAAVVDRELRANQLALDPFLTNEVRFFRAPGGGWGPFAAGIVDGDPYLSRMIGPIAWDVDRKDWEGSVQRVPAAVVAARYLASIESAGHGIVLLHDRVGQVGSTYGLEIAQALIPQLEARGFVFAAPVLRFGPVKIRHHVTEISHPEKWIPESLRLVDINADGRADVCGRTALGGPVTCATAAQHVRLEEDGLPRTIFRPRRELTAPETAAVLRPNDALLSGDLNGDGRDDVCARSREGITCALATPRGLTKATLWLPIAEDDVRFDDAAWRLGDINADGRADLCGLTAEGIACAISP